MRIITVQWDNILDEEMRDYGLLLKVFKYSVGKHMPHVKFEHIKIPPPQPEEGKEYFMTKNTAKLDYWVDAVKNSDEKTAIMDCDMVVLQDISCAFDYEFDIGYTTRVGQVPLNGGLLFINPNERSIDFLEYWRDINLKMYKDVKFHTPWRNKYAGMNQASFGYCIENYNKNIMVAEFPCRVWNVCQEDWVSVDEKLSKCLHVKSDLRKSCLSGEVRKDFHKKAFDIWNRYLKETEENERQKIISR